MISTTEKCSMYNVHMFSSIKNVFKQYSTELSYVAFCLISLIIAQFDKQISLPAPLTQKNRNWILRSCLIIIFDRECLV